MVDLGVLLALLVFLSAIVVAVARRTRRKHMSLTVKWGKERLHVDLPTDPNATLAVLRNELAEVTGLDPTAFKLIHAGAVMKDDNAPLSAYKIRANSKIVLMEKGAPVPEPSSISSSKQKPSTPATEISTIAAVHSEISNVNKTIVPGLNAFLSYLSSPSDTEYTPPQSLTLEQEHTRLGELLLQSLLRLDVLAMDGAWTDARKERKGAVRSVQTMLERLDTGWKEHIHSKEKQSAQL